MPSPALWAQKQGAGRRANTPARGAGTGMGTGIGMGTGMGRKRIWATSSSTPPQRSRRLSSAGLEPVPLLGEELSRKHCTHRTWQMFSTAILHTQTLYSCALPRYANMMRIFISYMLENRKDPSLYKRPETFSYAPLCACKLELPPLWGADSQQNPRVGPPHSQWHSLLQQHVLLSCIVIPGLGVGMCTEGNKTQKNFSEGYKFLALG